MQQGAEGAVGWWCSGGTCSLVMPCIRRRLVPSLKISTCSEQRQAPSLSPSPMCPRVPSAAPQDIPVPMQPGTSTAHLACRVALVGDPHHVLCRGKDPECPRHGETPGTGRDMGTDRALELDPRPRAAEGTPSTGVHRTPVPVALPYLWFWNCHQTRPRPPSTLQGGGHR